MKFAVQYRWRLVAGTEETFRKAWREMTDSIRARHGTGGSRLHRTPEGDWLAYAVWPSREAWEEAGRQPSSNPEAGAAMKPCIEHSYGAVQLDIVDDLLG